MRIVAMQLLMFSTSAYVNAQIFKLDMAKCKTKSVCNAFLKTFKVGDNIKVVAWANITDPFNKGFLDFFHYSTSIICQSQ